MAEKSYTDEKSKSEFRGDQSGPLPGTPREPECRAGRLASRGRSADPSGDVRLASGHDHLPYVAIRGFVRADSADYGRVRSR